MKLGTILKCFTQHTRTGYSCITVLRCAIQPITFYKHRQATCASPARIVDAKVQSLHLLAAAVL